MEGKFCYTEEWISLLRLFNKQEFHSSSFNASVFHGFSTFVFYPLLSANDSLLITSFSTSVLPVFTNLAIGVTNANLQVIETETPPVADFNAAVSLQYCFNLQEYMDDIFFPPLPPPLSPTNFALDLDLDMDITLLPPYPSTNNILINNS